MRPIKGSIVALVTPFHEDGSVNFEKLKELLKEASSVIQEQMTIVRTLTEADNCSVPLSFLGENDMEIEEKEDSIVKA